MMEDAGAGSLARSLLVGRGFPAGRSVGVDVFLSLSVCLSVYRAFIASAVPGAFRGKEGRKEGIEIDRKERERK